MPSDETWRRGQTAPAIRATASASGLGGHGYQENVVSGDYVSGDEIDDRDGRFMLRFLYEFWRLCDQSIAQISEAQINHSARVTADRARVPTVPVCRPRCESSSCAHHDSDPPNRATTETWLTAGTIAGSFGCTRCGSGIPANIAIRSSTSDHTSRAPRTNH